MSAHYFRAVAVDYDGTITTDERPDAALLRALAESRAAGLRMVLVTGRILEELRRVFPEVEREFDAIVAENGAVIWSPARGPRIVAPPVSHGLEAALRRLNVPVQRGQVLLATASSYDQAILWEISRLGLECQLIHNRAALMVLPAGITKGTGLLEALGDLGVSRHSTIGIGDAENDHSLFDTCELGVAVANAVDGLKHRADVVLPQPDGAGITAFLGGVILGEQIRAYTPRREVRLGSYPDGRAATIPSAQVNMLVTGGTLGGKSCLANLLADRLIARGYSVCVVDPEGDHLSLGRLPGVVTLGGGEELPREDLLRHILQHGVASTVIDLSLRPAEEKQDQYRRIAAMVPRIREATGLPHWVILDEGHLLPGAGRSLFSSGDMLRGLCVITYRPVDLSPSVLGVMDLVVAMPGTDPGSLAELPLHPALAGRLTQPALDALTSLRPDSAILIDRRGAREFQVDRLTQGHVRHWHKYLAASLPPHRRFYFRAPTQAADVVAANMAEFHDAVLRVEPDVLRHHAGNGDFSRWISGVIRDEALAGEVQRLEQSLGGEGNEEGFRGALAGLIERWFPEGEQPAVAAGGALAPAG